MDWPALAEEIYRFCRARCFNSLEAEDLAQDILFMAWQSRTRLERAGNPGGYLYGICQNVYRAHVRTQRRSALYRASVPPEALPLEQPDVQSEEDVDYSRRTSKRSKDSEREGSPTRKGREA